MKSSIVGAACIAWMGGCASMAAHETARPEMFLTEAEAARRSAAELIRMYVADDDGAALQLSSRTCPAHSARADSLITGLLMLPPSGHRTRDYALSWQKLVSHCADTRIAAWYRAEIRERHDDLTVKLLTTGLLRSRDPVNIAAVKKAAFDTAQTTDARMVMLGLFVEELNFSGEERVDLMIESYRQTGEIPGSFAADQAPLLWNLRTRQWREALLAEVVADPGRRGAPPLLLTLAVRTRGVSDGSPWRKVWETALTVLAQHPQSSAELKSMIPIAEKVARSTRE
jgi:hypothetical protein